MVLIDQLVEQGVTDFFFAPGSRNTPLLTARHPKMRLHPHFDERGLGFYALGCAMAMKKPVAIIVTSGTAVGNLLPAVMEAHHSSIPLILLTADRPAELRETAANQTCDQLKIFQNFVRWQFDFDPSMPPKAIRSHAAQAISHAQNGPVHLNCPFREPLYPPTPIIHGTPILLESPSLAPSPPRSLPAKGLILLGRGADLPATLKLAQKLQWPVLADILSNARLTPTPEQIRYFDWILAKAPRPDCVLHFGDRLTSKRLMDWLSAVPPRDYFHISPNWYDAFHLVTGHLSGTNFHNTPDPSWLPTWQALDRPPTFDTTFTETNAMRLLNDLPLDNTAIFLGNSMPIREADWFLFPKKAAGFYANRGLSGIDGNIATIAGLSLKTPVLGIIGDLTALHDLNSLHLLKNRPATLLISNNNGCGIFSHLAVSADPDFEKLWGFPHHLSFEHAARQFGLSYTKVSDAPSLAQAIEAQQAQIIELITNRHTNALSHKLLKASC